MIQHGIKIVRVLSTFLFIKRRNWVIAAMRREFRKNKTELPTAWQIMFEYRWKRWSVSVWAFTFQKITTGQKGLSLEPKLMGLLRHGNPNVLWLCILLEEQETEASPQLIVLGIPKELANTLHLSTLGVTLNTCRSGDKDLIGTETFVVGYCYCKLRRFLQDEPAYSA